ncbi:MAG: DUF2304 family protein [Patescibacteria group bacterium]|nr:DUF2304 family protein [Patescibacteria group bacterium]MDD5172943.1 DUF2304 family protein [Patescibacteria group bacterium]
MLQRILALIIIVFFISRVFWQKRKKQIQVNEFVFWLVFWALAGILVLFLKQIDKFVSYLGFSASGIDILLYLGIAILFYFIFRLRLKLAKIEKDITVIVRNIALKDEK